METNALFYLFLVLLNFLIAIWLTGLWTALLELSWAKIRKLDPQKRGKLIARSQILLERRTNNRIIVRVMTLTNLGGASINFYILVHRLIAVNTSIFVESACALIIFFLFVFLSEIFGHALLAPRQWLVLSLSVPVLEVLSHFFNPAISFVILLQKQLNLFRNHQGDEDKATTADEIISLVENDAKLQGETATLEASERKMIRGIFDLDETLVKEVMTPRVDIHALKLPSSISEVRKMIVECGHSRIPVYEERIDEIVGLIYAKDLLDEEKIKNLKSLDVIMHPPVFIPETKNVSELLEEFKQTKNQIAVIIDEYGGTAGLVTIEDILEEIVGEIHDEYDTEEDEPRFIFNEDGSLTTDARVAVDRINELLSMSIPEEEDYDTIGGYITGELGRIPKPMEIVDLPGIKVQILEANDRKISKLKLNTLDMENGDSEAAV